MSEGNLHGLGLCSVRELGVLVLFCCVLFIYFVVVVCLVRCSTAIFFLLFPQVQLVWRRRCLSLSEEEAEEMGQVVLGVCGGGCLVLVVGSW